MTFSLLFFFKKEKNIFLTRFHYLTFLETGSRISMNNFIWFNFFSGGSIFHVETLVF